jgi:hypothetical protein
VLSDGRATHLDGPVELGPGERLRRRLGPTAGLAVAYPSADDATSVAAAATVIVEVTDSSGRQVRIVHPPPE